MLFVFMIKSSWFFFFFFFFCKQFRMIKKYRYLKNDFKLHPAKASFYCLFLLVFREFLFCLTFMFTLQCRFPHQVPAATWCPAASIWPTVAALSPSRPLTTTTTTRWRPTPPPPSCPPQTTTTSCTTRWARTHWLGERMYKNYCIKCIKIIV